MHALARLAFAPLLTLAVTAPALALEPGPEHGAVAAAVARTLQTGHYAARPLDDELSAEWFDRWLESLDWQRVYFLKSDVDAFKTFRRTLDDDLRREVPQLTAAYRMHDVLVQRMHERIDFAKQLLDSGEITFDDEDATMQLDRSEAPWATSTEELDALWTKRVTEELLRMTLARPEDGLDEAVERLERRYDRLLNEQEDLEAVDVLEIYLAALGRSFDPHSIWMKPFNKESFDIDMSDSLTGIGAVLSVDDGYTTIRELVAGGPADSTGELHAGDQILAVAQGDEEAVDVVDMRLDRVVQMIRGPKDTEVVLTVHPKDALDPAERVEVRILRDRVKLDRAAASGEIREVEGKSIGVIDVPSFYIDSQGRRQGRADWSSTSRDMAHILDGFRKDGVDVVVVDLRANGGGALDEAIAVTGLFIDRGPVVQIRDSRGAVDVLDDEERGTAWDGPLVVLTSEGSASASEIFAGAIQDYRRGLVVGGDGTHGKGTVQNLLGLGRYLQGTGYPDAVPLAGALKFTTHMFFRINGESTQVKGVTPDIRLPSPLEGLDIKESDLENPLPWTAIKPARYKAADLPVDLTALRRASATRVSQSMAFAFLEEDLMARAERRDRDTISLHEATRKAEMDRMKARAEAREQAWRAAGFLPPESDTDDGPEAAGSESDRDKAAGDTAESEAPGIPDAVLEETILIARDLVSQLEA